MQTNEQSPPSPSPSPSSASKQHPTHPSAHLSTHSSIPFPAPPNGDNYHLHTDMLDSPPSPTPCPLPLVAPPPPSVPHKESWLDDDILDQPDGVQQMIRLISRHQQLSEEEKNRRRQHVLSYRFWKRQAQQTDERRDEMLKQAHVVSYSEFTHEDGQPMLGCKHYPRACKLKAACCDIWIVCRHCHDEAMDHPMNRFQTETVMCMRCNHIQPVGPNCQSCAEPFASYYCSKCRFYDNTPDKNIYHCDMCRICRVGKGLEQDNFHCMKCNACVSNEYSRKHRCLKNSLDANCPICGLYLFTSTLPVVFMRCGHTMHSHCFDEYTMQHFTCPLCHKPLTNMTPFYRDLDRMLEQEQMPEDQRDKMVEVLCHDCDQRCNTNFHYAYMKCTNCHGYNTRRIGDPTEQQPSSSDPMEMDTDAGEGSSQNPQNRQPIPGDLRQIEALAARRLQVGIFDYADEQDDDNVETIEVETPAANSDIATTRAESPKPVQDRAVVRRSDVEQTNLETF